MAIASYQSADEHSRGSIFSGQDLALVKSGQWLPELSHFVPINSPHDIDVNLDHARDDGEKIDLLLTTALNPHTDTLRCLGEFIQSRDLTILAATLRAFASIGEMLKDSSLDPEYRHHLEHLRWVLTENLDLTDDDNPSVQLFKRLCQEAESGSSDLIRWAAAYALQQLNYPAGLRRQLLSKPPAEIATDIVPKYGGQLSGRESPLADREYLKFWVYGATEGLFSGGHGTYYLEAVREVLSKLGMRGVRLALQFGNKAVLVEAINFAGGIFGNSLYKDEATRRSLVERLLPFLNRNDDLEVRNLAAEKLNDTHNQNQVSKNFLEQFDQIRVAIIDLDWRRVVALGEVAVPLLCEVVEGKLRLRDTNNISLQIRAVETINEILTEPSRKAAILSPYLQHDDDKLRMRVANLLKPFQSDLDDPSYDILQALLFTLELPYESNLNPLDELAVENYLIKIDSYQQDVQEIFLNAISVCRKSSIAARNFLKLLKDKFLIKLEIQKIHEIIDINNCQLEQYRNKINSLSDKLDWLKRKEGIEGVIFFLCFIPVIVVYHLSIIFLIAGVVITIYILFRIVEVSRIRKIKESIEVKVSKILGNINFLEQKEPDLKSQLSFIENKLY